MSSLQGAALEPNDVPEFLNELIPYRCPKCGHTRRFATLRELRHHLQRDHAYKMGCVKPHPRASIFNSPSGKNDLHKPLQDEDADDIYRLAETNAGSRVRTKYRINAENYYKREERESSPLLQSFKDEAEKLEQELQKAKHVELRNKAASLHQLSNSSVTSDLKSSLDGMFKTNDPKTGEGRILFRQLPSQKLSLLSENLLYESPSAHSDKLKSSLSVSHDHNLFTPNADQVTFSPSQRNTTEVLGRDSSALNHSVHSLNAEIMKSRFSQWATSDALYETNDILREMERALEKCSEQHNAKIEQLAQDLRRKDRHLQTSALEHAQLREERERLLTETESLMKQADEYNSSIRQQLRNRDNALATVNKELGRLKEISQKEMRAKDNDVQEARERVVRLEWERDSLIQETERLLQQADTDSDLLRQTVALKETELRRVNNELKELQQNQESMLEKTMAIYRHAEESREAMKVAVDTKEEQLHHAMQQIDAMQALHQRLVEQSRVLTEQADENTNSMGRLLKVKIDQIDDLRNQLLVLKEEKQRLEGNSVSLAEKAESTSSLVDTLKETVREKEQHLRTTQTELQNLKSYLRATADKERIARDHLETFIEDLIGRAERAEAELQALKSQSTTSIDSKTRSLDDQSVLTTKMEVTEGQKLQTKTQPVKPHRKTLPTKTNDERRVPAWRSGINDTYEPKHANAENEQTASSKSESVSLNRNSRSRPYSVSPKLKKKAQMPNRVSGNGISRYANIPSKRVDVMSSDSESDGTLNKGKTKRSRVKRKAKSSVQNKRRSRPRSRIGGSRIRSSFDTTRDNPEFSEIEQNDNTDTDYNSDRGRRKDRELSDLTPDSDVNLRSVSTEKDTKRGRHFAYANGTVISQDTRKESKFQSSFAQRRPTSVGHSLSIEGEEPSTSKGYSHGLEHGKKLEELGKTTRKTLNNNIHRKSRSLSPVPSRSKEGTTKESNDYGHNGNEQLKTETLNLTDVLNVLNEPTNGGLDNLMDENGILWEDMDTLPDVSDSELDRVSPSGSEAIATKNTAATAVQPINQIPNVAADQLPNSLHFTTQPPNNVKMHLQESQNNVKTEHAMSQVKDIIRAPALQAQMVTVNTVNLTSTNEFSTGKIIDKSSLFRPIRPPSVRKTSLSDKESTSGGREVHLYMKVSPKITSSEMEIFGVAGSPRTKSDLSQQEEDRSISWSQENVKIKEETMNEKIKRISDKYSPKQEKYKVQVNGDLSLSEKIEELTEKYKYRRNQIMDGRGVQPIDLSSGARTKHKSSQRAKSDSDKSLYVKPDYGNGSLTDSKHTFTSSSSHKQPGFYSRLGYQMSPNATLPGNNIPGLPDDKLREISDFEKSQKTPLLSDGEIRPSPNSHIAKHEENSLTNSKASASDSKNYVTNNLRTEEQHKFQEMSNNGRQNGFCIPEQQVVSGEGGGHSSKTPTKESHCDETERKGTAPHSFTLPTEDSDMNAEFDPFGLNAVSNTLESKRNLDTVETQEHTNVHGWLISESYTVGKHSQIDRENDEHRYQRLLDDSSEEQQTCADDSYEETSFERQLGERINLNLRTVKSTKKSDNISKTQTQCNNDQELMHDLQTFSASNNPDRINSPNLSLFEDVNNSENSYTLSKPMTSAFAIEIDNLSADYDTQSFIDLPDRYGSHGYTDQDTDTDAFKIEDVLDRTAGEVNASPSGDKMLSRNANSSASSQASFEILDRIPFNLREATRRRRAALVKIFSFLDITSLCKAAQVCREWRLICRSPNLWKVVRLVNVSVSLQFFKHLGKRCSKLRVLVLQDLLPEDKAREDLRSAETSITSYDSGFEHLMKKAESTLHTIAIVNCGGMFSAKCLWTASCSCRMLRHVTYLSHEDMVNPEVMWALGSGCRDLQTLKVHPLMPNPKSELFTTRCVQMIGQCFQDLTTLSLGGKHIDLPSLPFVAKRCQKLQHLELHDMRFVTCEVIDACCVNGLKSLSVVWFQATPVAPGCILLLHENCSHLKSLGITLKQGDHSAEVKDGITVPEYTELVEGYQAIQKQKSLALILKLNVEKPDINVSQKPAQSEKSFFQKWFG